MRAGHVGRFCYGETVGVALWSLMRDYKGLSVHRKAHELVLLVYRVTSQLPTSERFELTRQMRTAAISIAANIVEGCGRGSDADFARFLDMATGSANELRYYSELAQDLGFLEPDAASLLYDQATEVIMMLAALTQTVRSRGHRPPRPTSTR